MARRRIVPRASEGMTKSLNEQNYLAQRRKGAENETKMQELFIVSLCVAASRREIVCFLTPAHARATNQPPASGRKQKRQSAAAGRTPKLRSSCS